MPLIVTVSGARYREPQSRDVGLPVGTPLTTTTWNKPTAFRAPSLEPRFPLPVVLSPGATPGEDVMARLIQELLLLTCMGGFVAGVTYAVTLLH